MKWAIAIIAWYMRKRNKDKSTTWGPFSSTGKLLSSVSVQLIHWVLFVASNSGSSSSWTPHAGLQAGPPGRDTAVGFVFGHVFCCSGYIFVRPEHKRGPLVQGRVLGSIKIKPTGQQILALSASEPDILSHCWTLGEAELIEKETYGEIESESLHSRAKFWIASKALREEGQDFGLTYVGFESTADRHFLFIYCISW